MKLFFFHIAFITFSIQAVSQDLEYDDMYFGRSDRLLRENAKRNASKPKETIKTLMEGPLALPKGNTYFKRSDQQYQYWVEDELTYGKLLDTNYVPDVSLTLSDLEIVDLSSGELSYYDPYFSQTYDPIYELIGYPSQKEQYFKLSPFTNPWPTPKLQNDFVVKKRNYRTTPVKRTSSSVITASPSSFPNKLPSKNNNGKSSSPQKSTYSRKRIVR